MSAQRDVLAERHRVPLGVAVPGPDSGSHTMPWLRTSPGRGASTMAPTRIGTPIAVGRGVDAPALISASRNGSIAVEFSGQSTKSGRGLAARVHVGRERHGGVDVVARSPAGGRAGCRSPSPGTLPCTAATVAEPSLGRVYAARPGTATTATAPAAIAATALGLRQPPASVQARPVPISAIARLTPLEPIHGSASASGVSTTANARRPQGIPLNGHWPRHTSAATQASAVHSGQTAAAHELRGHRPQHPEEERLQPREREPGVGTDRAHPAQQHQLEAEPEGQPGDPGEPRSHPAQAQHERRHAERRQKRPGHRLEGQRRRRPRGSRQG